MSQRQEELRARLWKEVHEPVFEEMLAEARKIKTELAAMTAGSEEYKNKETEYNAKQKAAEDFFMKFQES